jgi:hypothetical protein
MNAHYKYDRKENGYEHSNQNSYTVRESIIYFPEMKMFLTDIHFTFSMSEFAFFCSFENFYILYPHIILGLVAHNKIIEVADAST